MYVHVHQILAFFQDLENDISGREKMVDELRNLCAQMCDKVKESSSKFDLKNKLSTVERPFKDVSKKLCKCCAMENYHI
jgi:hypothetical protein